LITINIFTNKLDRHLRVNWGLNKFLNKNFNSCLATVGMVAPAKPGSHYSQ